MSQRTGARIKGWIKNNESGQKMSFQFNPEGLTYSRSASYVDISAPGMAYPNTQFVKGNIRSFSTELFLYDNPCTGVISEAEDFLNELLPPESNSRSFTQPPDLTFCLGYFVRKCVLEDFSVYVERFDERGKAIQARFTLQLRQVGV